jgi:hypothetical protein
MRPWAATSDKASADPSNAGTSSRSAIAAA